jgi:hypothetical protein
MKKSVHITVNKKCGVGQSMIAASLMQYFDQHDAAQGIDLDTSISTLSQYGSLDVELIDATSSGDCSSMSGNKLNSLVERIIVDDKDYVIDASCFSYSGICKFFCEPTVVNKLVENNIEVFFHIVISGGSKLTESLQNVTDLIESYPNIKIYAWLNAYTGDVILANKKFEGMNVYIKYSKNFAGIINIDKLPSYSEPDVKEMLEEHMTIADVENSKLDDAKKAKMKRFTDTLISRIGKAFQG